jgi:hypothetical protein
MNGNVKMTVVAAMLCGVGLAACGAEGEAAMDAQAAAASQQALRAMVRLERPMFSVPGINVSVDDEGLHIRGVFPGGNPGFLPPTFTVYIDGESFGIMDTSWSMTSPSALADKIVERLKDRYDVEVTALGADDVLVQIYSRD